MKCSSELLTLAMSALVLGSACADSAASSTSSEASAGSDGTVGGRTDKDRGGIDLIDAGAAHGGGQVQKSSDAGTSKAAAPKGGSEAVRDAGGSVMKPMAADAGAPDRGPYYEAEPWKGYFWTATHGNGTTLMRAQSFEASTFDSQVCVKGSVARTPDSAANAMLGINVNQAKYPDAPPGTLVPSKQGVQVEVTNPGASPLRVQVAAPDGVSNAQSRWCAVVTGSGGFIPWSDFNTACWDGSGDAYHHEPISVAMLLVPGNSESALTFDFCLMRLAEADAPPPGTGAGASTTGSAGMAAAGGGGSVGMSVAGSGGAVEMAAAGGGGSVGMSAAGSGGAVEMAVAAAGGGTAGIPAAGSGGTVGLDAGSAEAP